MTAMAIKRAFQNLDPSDQAKVLTELAATLARSLADQDDQDAALFRRRKREEPSAKPLSAVKRRLLAKRGR